jgi:ADP-ribose pyrophosphatase
MADVPGFRVARRTPVAEAGFLRIEAIDVTTPGGGEVRRYAVRHPGAVAVIPVDGDDIILIRQYRAPVETNLLEVPAGKLDVAGEPPAETAARELEEEIGMRAGHIEPVFGFWTGPGFTDEYMYLFVATDMEPVPTAPHGPEEEASELVRVPRRDLRRLLASGEIQDVKTLVALQWLALGDS